MNNEAFRALVNQPKESSSSREKSTKEIAREAVEEEFRRRKQKRRGKKRSLDDDSSDSSDDDGKPERKKHQDEQQNQENRRKRAAMEDDDKLKYRDRARERREGKVNADYQDSSMIDNVDTITSAEMSKYLGGDEAHTHLVKGLDVALARKVRRDMKRQQQDIAAMQHKDDDDEDLDNVLAQAQKTTASKTFTVEQAKAIVAAKSSNISTNSSLAQSVVKYLQRRYNVVMSSASTAYTPILLGTSSGSSSTTSTAGLAIQRSTLSFTTNTTNRIAHCWVAPRETTVMSRQQQDDDEFGSFNRLVTPLEQQFISQIKLKTSALSKQSAESLKEAKTKEAKKKEAKRHHQRHTSSNKENNDMIEQEDGNGNNHDTNAIEHLGNESSEVAPPVDSSDEDIFAGVGEYVPPT